MKISGPLVPITAIFVIVTILIVAFSGPLIGYGFDPFVLGGANTLFFFVSLLVFAVQKKAMLHANPNVFVRSVIAGMMIKMFATVIAVMAYVLITGNGYNKRSVFVSLFIYLLYLGAEATAIRQLNKRPNA